MHHFFYSADLKIENQYIIHFKGLKDGVHQFEFVLEKPFFEEYERLEVQDGKVVAKVTLDRKTNFLDLDVLLEGNILVVCDRCLDTFRMDVETDGHLVVRFTEDEQENTDEIMYLHPEDHQLNLKHYFYESLSVSIPYRKVHPDQPDGRPGCNPEMLGKLESFIINH